MPAYRIITQTDHTAHAAGRLPHKRAQRSDPRVEHDAFVIHAPDLVAVLAATSFTAVPDGQPIPRIVAVEEVFAPNPNLSDTELDAVLTRNPNESGMEPFYYEDDKGYNGLDFNDLVDDVLKALVQDPRFEGTSITFDEDYSAIIEVRDTATGAYRSQTVSERNLTADREATGWEAVRAVARAVIDLTDQLR